VTPQEADMSEWTAETAQWYADKYGEYPTNRLTIDALEIAADAVVVDVGCGTGAALRHASARVTLGRLLGFDPVPRMVEIARERLVGHAGADRIEIAEAHVHALPLEDGCADLVLALDSFDHWGDDKAPGLRELRRVIDAEGRFVMVKDAGAPSAAAAAGVVTAVTAHGFGLVETRHITEGEVAFALWIFSPA
jgi:ubiquinone/menaquinone biosynthesis C-methylase UbiE